MKNRQLIKKICRNLMKLSEKELELVAAYIRRLYAADIFLYRE